MRVLLIAIVASLGLLIAAPAKKPAAKAKKSTPAAATRKPVAKKSTSTASRQRRGAGYMQGQRLPGQRVPTPERYKEIETALSARGYLAKEPDGTWDAASIAAMKKFQSDQNLEPTGRLTSLSLIGLGLGPKYESTAVPPQP